jgi:hypothetical protein
VSLALLFVFVFLFVVRACVPLHIITDNPDACSLTIPPMMKKHAY